MMFGTHTHIWTTTTLTDKAPPSGDESERFSTVARSSSTLAEIGADPLLSGLISTRIFRSCSSFSESLSESEEKISGGRWGGGGKLMDFYKDTELILSKNSPLGFLMCKHL